MNDLNMMTKSVRITRGKVSVNTCNHLIEAQKHVYCEFNLRLFYYEAIGNA